MGVFHLQISGDSRKVDYITIDGNIVMHKQIETRNGITFMRMKKRIIRNGVNP